jgi:hypothetical protein
LEVQQSEEVVVLLTVVVLQLLEVQVEAVVPLNLDQVQVQRTKVTLVVHPVLQVVFILPVVVAVLVLSELLVQEVMVEMVVPERQVVLQVQV